MFKKIRSVRLTYRQQIFIYALCQNLTLLPDREQCRVKELCRKIGREHHEALYKVLTTQKSMEEIARKHYVSPSTLYRLRKEFYEGFLSEIDLRRE